MKSLAERVKRAMEAKGCDVRTLAAACRIKPPSVHGWLNGSSMSMAAGPCLRAAAYLGVSAIWLAEGEGPMTPADGSVVLVSIGAPPADDASVRPLVKRVTAVATNINDVGLKKVLKLLDGVAEIHPAEKAKKGARAA